GFKAVRAGAVFDVIKAFGDAEEAEVLRLMDDGDDEAFVFQRGADADVDVGKHFKAVIVEAAVHVRHGAHGGDAGGDEIGGEREVRSLRLEFGAALLAVGQNAGEVRLEQGGDVRRGGDGAHHVLGDGAAHGIMRENVAGSAGGGLGRGLG